MTDGGRPAASRIVLDASAMVDLLLGTSAADSVRTALRDRSLAVPAHFDAEVVSAIARLQRSGELSPSAATERVERLAAAPIERHPLPPLLPGAWARRGDTRVVDALYLELGVSLDAVVLTTDRRLARAHPSTTRVPDDPG